MSASSLKLARRCGIELKGALQQLCVGHYTEDLKLSSGDSYMELGDPYGIYFLDLNPSVCYVLFHSSETRHCQTLIPTNGTLFECYDGIAKNSTLVGLGKLRYVTCANHHVAYTDALLKACGANINYSPSTSVLHYSEQEQDRDALTSIASCLMSWECCLLVVLFLFMCVIFRWHN